MAGPADNAAEAPVELVVNAANRAAVEGLLEAGSPPLPVTIVEEHTLGPGQAYIRAGGGETAVDIDTVLKEINEAVGGFLGTGPGEERLNHA